MAKGRHRRHQTARQLKEHGAGRPERCIECRRTPHADWCRADEEDPWAHLAVEPSEPGD